MIFSTHLSHDSVFVEQVKVLFDNAPSAQLANLVVAVIFMVLLWDSIETQRLYVWGSIMALMLLCRATLIVIFRRSVLTPENAWLWARRYILFTFPIGMTWGAAAFLFQLGDSLDFAMFILGGLMAGAIASNASVLLAYFAFALPIALPLSLMYALQGGSDNLIKSGLVIFYIIVMMRLATHYCHSLRKAQELHIEHKRISEELRVHRDQLQESVAEKVEDLNKAKAVAESANIAKNEFLANMTHELRTPMHAILSFADLGIEQAKSAPRQQLRDYFTYIHVSGKRLLTLLNDVLDMAKFEAHGMVFDFRENDVHKLARMVAAELSGLIEKNGLSLEVVDSAADTRVNCDETRILQVLRNLIANALKISPAGTEIKINFDLVEIPAGRRTSDIVMVPAVRVSVMDEGVGIPEAELESIFHKFIQSSKTKSGAGGTGLGLAICKEIVEAHGGAISARNKQTGGAVFSFTLPLKARPSMEPPAEPLSV